MGEFRDLALRTLDVMGQIFYRAELGNEAGVIPDPDNPGFVYVRVEVDGGTAMLRSVRNVGTLQMIPGAKIWLKKDAEGQLAIAEADFSGQVGQGLNPAINNAGDKNITGITNQRQFQTFLSHPTNPPSLTVLVRGLLYLLDGAWVFSEDDIEVDLSAYVPTNPNMHLLAGIFLDNTNAVVVGVSTERSLSDLMDEVDIQEAYDDVTDIIATSCFWRLYTGQTEIKDEDAIFDGRQIINVTSTSGGGSGDALIAIRRSWFGI